jgi:hypothetical protein
MEKENKKARKIKSEKLNKILALRITVKQYEIDFDKVKSLDDVVVILKAMKVTLSWYSEECPDQFKEIYEKGFLKEK